MALKTIVHQVDFCVIGGGLSGMCAAISAARHGAKVALMHERPVLGGNCSSEIRMWVSGAHGDNNRETGLMEEILWKTTIAIPIKITPCGIPFYMKRYGLKKTSRCCSTAPAWMRKCRMVASSA